VFVIAHRRLLDERRNRSRRPTVVDESFEESSDWGNEPAGGDAEADALRALATERVQAICSRLVPDQRDVLLLRIVGDLTVDQIAEVLDKSPGAVKQLQRRGFEAVRRLLSREGVTL
jgi:RNA polymerase sigma-70 factor (ECF subfamily)